MSGLLDLFRTMEYLKIEYARYVRRLLEDEERKEDVEC